MIPRPLAGLLAGLSMLVFVVAAVYGLDPTVAFMTLAAGGAVSALAAPRRGAGERRPRRPFEVHLRIGPAPDPAPAKPAERVERGLGGTGRQKRLVRRQPHHTVTPPRAVTGHRGAELVESETVTDPPDAVTAWQRATADLRAATAREMFGPAPLPVIVDEASALFTLDARHIHVAAPLGDGGTVYEIEREIVGGLRCGYTNYPRAWHTKCGRVIGLHPTRGELLELGTTPPPPTTCPRCGAECNWTPTGADATLTAPSGHQVTRERDHWRLYCHRIADATTTGARLFNIDRNGAWTPRGRA